MKILLVILCLLTGLSADAQEEIKVTVQERPSSQGIQPAFETEIPQATSADAIRILELTLSPSRIFSKRQKFVQDGDEWIMRDVDIKKISSGPITVFAQVSSFPERIFMKIFLKDSDGFIGVSPETGAKTEDASKLIRDFAVEVYRDAVGKELRNEQVILKSREQDLKKMRRKSSQNERRINGLKSDNIEMRNENREYQMQLGRKENFSTQGENVQIILYQHEIDAKKLEKEIRSNQRNINRNERKISKFERQSTHNLREQGDILNQIDKQKIVVNDIESKLRNIR